MYDWRRCAIDSGRGTAIESVFLGQYSRNNRDDLNLTSADTVTDIYTNAQCRIQIFVESFEENVNWHEYFVFFPGYLCGLHVGKGEYPLYDVPTSSM